MMYHVFAGDNYYPQGGTADYIGSFSDLDWIITNSSIDEDWSHFDWFEVVVQDADTGRLVPVYNKVQGLINQGVLS